MLTPKEVAKITGVSVKTLANWRCSKKHLSFHRKGRKIYYDRNAIEAFAASQRVEIVEVK